MIQLIHGTDIYLSLKELQAQKHGYENKGYEVHLVNADDTDDISDPSKLYGVLSEQDLFGAQKLIIIKRIASSELFYYHGKAKKGVEKLFEEIKQSVNEVILWEDKTISNKNPLFNVSNTHKLFLAPYKSYELGSYLHKNFNDVENSIKSLIASSVQSFDTFEMATEIEKFKNTPKEYLNNKYTVLSKNTPAWTVSDSLAKYLLDTNIQNLENLFKSLSEFDEDIRYKLAIIQNQVSDIFMIKKSKEIPEIRPMFFATRTYAYQKLSQFADKVDSILLYNIYKKSLIVEYLLNNGIILEKIALEYIFAQDVKSMSWELIY